MAEYPHDRLVHFWTEGLHTTLCETDEDFFDWSDVAGDVTCDLCLEWLEEMSQRKRDLEDWNDADGMGRHP